MLIGLGVSVSQTVKGRAFERSRTLAIALLSLAAALALAGCGLETGYPVEVGPGPGPIGNFPGPAFTVTVKAGAVPIAGAAVQLYAAGSTGNGTGATSLLAQTVDTGSNGMAAIAANYTCPYSNSPVYLIAKGGKIGAAAANANSWLMTTIGPCNSLTAGENLVIDEVTTVAAAYAVAPFYAAGGTVGASATNTVGLTNAFATAATLGDPVSGRSPGSTLPANAVSPAARVNSLANMVNACVVSAAACAGFYSASSAGGTPVNTLDAMVRLSQNPTANVAALYTYAGTSTAYSPVLSAQPADWSMFLSFGGGGMSSPTGMGVDSQGNVWVASFNNVASKFSPIGAPIFANGVTGNGLDQSYGLAIDLNDDAWIPNREPFQAAENTGSVSEFSSSGASLSGAAGFIGSGIYYPSSVAIDPDGTVWVVDYGDSRVTLLNLSGTPLSGASGYESALFTFPVVVVVDANHNGWVGNQGAANVTKVAPDGSSFTDYATGLGPSGLAIDQGDNVWSANYYDDSVTLLNNGGTMLGTFTGNGSLVRPQGIAVDGAGNVWVANYRASSSNSLNYLVELAGSSAVSPGSPLSPANGIGSDAGLLEAYALAIDASGDLWVSNSGTNLITKFVGLAAPVKTPLSGVPKLP